MDSPFHDRENLQKTQEGTPNVRTGTWEEEESSSASSGRTSRMSIVSFASINAPSPKPYLNPEHTDGPRTSEQTDLLINRFRS